MDGPAFLIAPAFAQSNQKPTKAETDLTENLLPLVQKGLVIPAKIEPQDEDGLNLTHVQKYGLLQSIMADFDNTKMTPLRTASGITSPV